MLKPLHNQCDHRRRTVCQPWSRFFTTQRPRATVVYIPQRPRAATVYSPWRPRGASVYIPERPRANAVYQPIAPTCCCLHPTTATCYCLHPTASTCYCLHHQLMKSQVTGGVYTYERNFTHSLSLHQQESRYLNDFSSSFPLSSLSSSLTVLPLFYEDNEKILILEKKKLMYQIWFTLSPLQVLPSLSAASH